MYPECRHILTSGRKCQSPALNNKAYCYFHMRYRRQAPRQPTPGQELQVSSGHPIQSVAIPVLEDRGAVQMAISEVLHALACSQLDPRRAGLLLYGLQIASQNSAKDQAIADRRSIRTLTRTPQGEELGPSTHAPDLEDFNEADDEDDAGHDGQDDQDPQDDWDHEYS